MLIKDFINYLLKPEYIPVQDSGGSLKSAWASFRIWTLVFLISLLGIPISFYISKIFNTSFADHAAYQYAANRTMLQVVWGAILFFPVWEEFVFRLGLKFSRLNLSLGLASLIVYMSRLFLSVLDITRPSWLFAPDTIIGIFSIIVPIIVLTATIWFTLSYIGDKRMHLFYQRRFKLIFYTPLVTFAFLHALNFEQVLWLFAPLITLPQIFLAAGFGYIRMKYGIRWSILVHILNNAFSFLPALILEKLSPSIFNRYIQGDLTAISELPPDAAAVYFVFSLVFSALLMGIFLSWVGLIWDWASTRKGLKRYAFLSTTLNCLLPGLGQLYNGQSQKGRVLISVFMVVSFIVAIIFSLPASSSSMGQIVRLGIGTLVVYLAIYAFATTDSWIIGRRLDKATMSEQKGKGSLMNIQIKILRDPAQLSGAVLGLLAGWAIALTIMSNAWLYKPLALAAGVLGGMLIGWAIWLAIALSLFLYRQTK